MSVYDNVPDERRLACGGNGGDSDAERTREESEVGLNFCSPFTATCGASSPPSLLITMTEDLLAFCYVVGEVYFAQMEIKQRGPPFEKTGVH